MNKPKALIAFDDIHKAQQLKEQLEERGFDGLSVGDGKQACDICKKWLPDYILMDLMLRDYTAVEALRELKNGHLLGPQKAKVFIISGHSSAANIRMFMQLGAVDYIVRPFETEELIRRLMFHSRQQRELTSVSHLPMVKPDANFFLHLVELVLKQTSRVSGEHDFLFRLTKMTSMALQAKRCSFIEAGVGHRDVSVLASSDNSKLRKHPIDLRKYPEVIHAVQTQKTVVLDNLENDPTMSAVQKLVKEVQFNAIIVVPVIIQDEVIGVLSARMPKEREGLKDEEIRFAQVVANCMGLGLSILRAVAPFSKSG